MAIEVRPITDRAQWLESRKSFVTASQIGGLPAFNCHPYITPLRIYAGMRGVEFPTDDDNKVLRRGRWLEPAVAKAVTELRPDWELTAPNVFLCDPEVGVGSTPDYYVTAPQGRGVCEMKTVAPSVWHRDWDEGKDIPLWVTLQCLTSMLLSDAAFGAVAVMLVDPHYMDVQILDVPRHAGAEAKIIAEVKRFMTDVREGREPAPDFVRDGAILKLLIPRESPGLAADLSGNNELPALLARRAEMMFEVKEMKKRCDVIENKLRFVLGDAALATGVDGFAISYRTEPRKAYSVPASTPRVLRIRDKRPADERPGGDDDDE